MKPSSFFLCVLALLSLHLHFLHGAAAEQTAPKAIIVLDASGSMWGQVSGQPKMKIAKDVVGDLLKTWDPKVELGLTVYGHRRKDDCSDIESVVRVGPLQHESFLKAVRDLNAKGKTPLSAAVKLAAEELKYTEGKATVILVSDGIETCDLDPCQVGQELEATGVDFTAHVVGFDVSKPEEVKQLRCLAENTGGKFFSASNASSLGEALREATQEVSRKKTGVELVAVNQPGGRPLERISWTVYEIDDNGGRGKGLRHAGGQMPTVELPPGKYIVEAKTTGQARAEKQFEVFENKLQREEVLLAQEGDIELVAVNEPGGRALEDMWWEIFPVVEDTLEKPRPLKYGGGNTPVYRLLPGKYRATVKSSKGHATGEALVEVLPGKKVRQEVLIAGEGEIELVAVNSPGGPVLEDMWWEVFPVVENTVEKPRPLKYGGGNTPVYRLVAGKYRATVKSSKGRATGEALVEVLPGKKLRHEVVIAGEGDIELVAVTETGGRPLDDLWWEIFEKTDDPMTKPKALKYGGGATPTYRLPAGTYRATVKSSKGTARAEQDVTVVANKKVRAEVIMAQEGEVQLVAVTQPGGTPLDGMTWSLYDIPEDEMTKPKTLKYGGGSTPTYRLAAGKYKVNVKSSKGSAVAEQEVEVIGGKKTRQEVLIPAEGELELRAVLKTDNAPVDRPYFKLLTIEEDLRSPKTVKTVSGNAAKLRAVAGRYTLEVSGGKPPVIGSQEVEILPGKVQKIDVEVDLK